MPHHRTRHRPRAANNHELAEINQHGAGPAQRNEAPLPPLYVMPDRQAVEPGNEIEEEDAAYQGLSVEELDGGQLQGGLVARDEERVDAAC